MPSTPEIADMRARFDEVFGDPAVTTASGAGGAGHLLIVGAGDDVCGLAIDALAGVHPCPPLTALPGAAPSLLGLAAVRGVIVGVHDLARLLGAPAATGAARWLVVSRAVPSLALAVTEILGNARVDGEPTPDKPARAPFAGAHVHTGRGRALLVDLARLWQALQAEATEPSSRGAP